MHTHTHIHFKSLGGENPPLRWNGGLGLHYERLFVCFKMHTYREREREIAGYKVVCLVTYTEVMHVQECVRELFRQVEPAGDICRARD